MTNTKCEKYQRNIAGSITIDFVEKGEEDGQLDDNHTQEDRPRQFRELFCEKNVVRILTCIFLFIPTSFKCSPMFRFNITGN